MILKKECKKGGMSIVIASVVLVLLGIVAAGLIWAFLSPYVTARLEESRVQSICAKNSFMITEAYQIGKELNFKIKRNGDNSEFDLIMVYIDDEKKFEITKIMQVGILSLNGATNEFNFEIGEETANTIFIVPQVESGNTDSICHVSQTKTIEQR